MPKSKERGPMSATPEPGSLQLTDIDVVPDRAVQAQAWRSGYKYRFTTGPFLLPEHAGSLDWVLLNNDGAQQTVCVTVFQCPIGATKTPLPPGPLVVTLNPGETTHNANTYPEGFVYEVEVECNSRLVFPYVSVWVANFGVIIPGTGINAGTFVRRMR